MNIEDFVHMPPRHNDGNLSVASSSQANSEMTEERGATPIGPHPQPDKSMSLSSPSDEPTSPIVTSNQDDDVPIEEPEEVEEEEPQLKPLPFPPLPPFMYPQMVPMMTYGMPPFLPYGMGYRMPPIPFYHQPFYHPVMPPPPPEAQEVAVKEELESVTISITQSDAVPIKHESKATPTETKDVIEPAESPPVEAPPITNEKSEGDQSKPDHSSNQARLHGNQERLPSNQTHLPRNQKIYTHHKSRPRYDSRHGNSRRTPNHHSNHSNQNSESNKTT